MRWVKIKRVHITTKRILEILQESKIASNSFFIPKSNIEIQFIKQLTQWDKLPLDQVSTDTPLELTPKDRCLLAIYALNHHSEPIELVEYLNWQEFEILTSLVLEEAGYQTHHRVRFRGIKMKWFEIDVLAWKKPYVLLIDCKRYSRRGGKQASLRNALEDQKRRLEDFVLVVSEIEHDFPFLMWNYFLTYPLLVSWLPEGFAIHDQMAVVPFNKLNSFILELDELRYDLYHQKIELT